MRASAFLVNVFHAQLNASPTLNGLPPAFCE